MKIKTDDIISFILIAAITSTIPLAMSCEQRAKDEHDKTFKPATENVDTIKIETKRDTVLVLDYKPRAKHSQSTTYATNKSGYEYKIHKFTNLPVERGDEIVIEIKTTTPPEGNSQTEYELVKNMTTEKLKQEYIKKH